MLYLKIELTEGDKCHNLMSWLIHVISIIMYRISYPSVLFNCTCRSKIFSVSMLNYMYFYVSLRVILLTFLCFCGLFEITNKLARTHKHIWRFHTDLAKLKWAFMRMREYTIIRQLHHLPLSSHMTTHTHGHMQINSRGFQVFMSVVTIKGCF